MVDFPRGMQSQIFSTLPFCTLIDVCEYVSLVVRMQMSFWFVVAVRFAVIYMSAYKP